MTTNYNFDFSDDTIHRFAASHLLSKYDSELILTQGNFAYQVKGGNSGYLLYKSGNRDWVRIADWCFYGLYIVVRYRKSIWLRPMYETLFARMNFVATIFNDYSIEIVGTDGQILRSRRFHLSPPSAFNRVMSEKFGWAKEKIQFVKTEVGLD